YLAPYPRGEAGAVYFNFKVKSGAVLSEVLLDGRPLNAGSGGSYAAPVVSGSLGRSVEIKVGGAASSVSYYIDMEPFSTSQSGMREVPLVKEGEAFTIGAQYVSDAYFAHVEFNGLERLEKVLFSDVRAAASEGGGVLEVRPEGSVLPSRWAAAEDGSVRVLDGDPEITAVFTGPRYYYDYLYVKDEVDDLASAFRSELEARAAAIKDQMGNLMNLMVLLSDAEEKLIDETDLEAIETEYAEDGAYTAEELKDEYIFLYFKVAGASAYRAVLISELETGPVSYDGASFSLVDGALRVEAAADSLEKLYGGFNEDDYRTLKAMEEQITLMYDLLHGNYVTAAMLEEARDGYYDKSEIDDFLKPVNNLLMVNTQAIAALQAALGPDFETTTSDTTVSARIAALNGELSTIKGDITAVTSRVTALEATVDAIKVKNVGNITKSDCNNLNNFVSNFRQPANTIYYGYVSAVTDIANLPPDTSTGFITCETGDAENIIRQIYRPAASAIVYERSCNKGSWGAWTRTDAAYLNSTIAGLNDRAPVVLQFTDAGSGTTLLVNGWTDQTWAGFNVTITWIGGLSITGFRTGGSLSSNGGGKTSNFGENSVKVGVVTNDIGSAKAGDVAITFSAWVGGAVAQFYGGKPNPAFTWVSTSSLSDKVSYIDVKAYN
ncbi:MAG: pyocin knob domain-containing protein, partial [Spirochaetaceae bacterium]|nr:pyocin knob domain-containing protein [Spirochaetaceae bacterium]